MYQMLNRNVLNKYYNEQFLSQREISEKFGCSRKHIGNLMKRYGIKVNPNRKRDMMKITNTHKEIVYGGLMGDSSVVYCGNGHRLQFAHMNKQEDYLNYKSSLLEPLIINKIDFNNGKGKFCYSTNHKWFSDIRKLFYPDGKKTVSNKILNKLTPLSIAIWFMDDGSRENSSKKFRAVLNTQSYSFKENEIIVDYFKNKYGINSKIHKQDIYYRIHFNSDSYKFYELIKNYIIPSMEYKFKGIDIMESVESIRPTLNKNSMMMCSGLHGNMQRHSEMNARSCNK